MVTCQTDPEAPQPLTQQDRDMLASYLARGMTPDNLKRDDIVVPNLSAWRRSPHITPHIEAFYEINALAEETCRTRARIEGFSAVSEALRSATTNAERLHAVHALIRLNSSCATGSPRLGEATSATRSTPAPAASPARPRDPYSNFHLPPLPPLGPRPASTPTGSPQAGPNPGSPNPRTAVPGSNASNTNGVRSLTPRPSDIPEHARAPEAPNPGTAVPGFSPATSANPSSHATPASPTRAPISTVHSNGSPLPIHPSSIPSIRPSSSLPQPTDSPAPMRDKSPARRLTEHSGAAPAGAWP